MAERLERASGLPAPLPRLARQSAHLRVARAFKRHERGDPVGIPQGRHQPTRPFDEVLPHTWIVLIALDERFCDSLSKRQRWR
jgi:hypothetical protein